jgi:amino acid adenylation domain-containing protein
MKRMAEDHRALLQDALLKIRALRSEVAELRRSQNEPVAVVGAGCRFPGAPDVDAYWRLLREGVDATAEVPADRWDAAAYYDPDPEAPGKMYVRRGGFLDDVQTFDAAFFGISPREALRLDPQQRLLLEVSWEALEDAALPPDGMAGSETGVFVGVMASDYLYRQIRQVEAGDIDPYLLSGNELSFGAARLAYQLGLQGPAMSVATACSSSLVAIHLAAAALRARECDLALAGGVNLMIDPASSVILSKLKALAADGRSKAFDASADGYGRGEGCGMLVLERLSDALKKGHRVLAVVRGSAVSHTGPGAGLTVPNGPAQEKLLRRAFAAAGVDPQQLDYVEAHGTGTPLGDPIEALALGRVMGDRKRPLLTGSVKSAIGHCEAAAGVAGVLKTILALQHSLVPPSLHFHTPNPHIPWERLPLRVARELTEWPAGNGSRTAGVSSFGLSGVNAHVVLEAAPAPAPAAANGGAPCLLPLSAKTPAALAALASRYAGYLERHPGAAWADICFTASHGRSHFEHRRYVIARSTQEALRQLQSGDAPRVDEPEWRRLEALGADYLRGRPVDWPTPAGARRVPLPTYPFERQRFWALDNGAPPPATVVSAPSKSAPALEPERLPLLESFCRQAAQVLGLAAPPDPRRCLLDLGLDSLMAAELQGWLQAEWGLTAGLRQILSEISIAELTASLRPVAAAEPLAPVPAAADETSPLSEGQKALWFIHQSDPASPAYNVGVALRIRAAVDRAAMRAAFQALVDRHPSLRSTFSAPEGEPVARIHASAPVWFDAIAAASEAELAARVNEAHRQPFDLSAGPLLRVRFFSLSPQDHVLLLSLHHIACDALSIWTMLEEFQALYGGRGLPPPRAAYRGFVGWQETMLAAAEGERLWEFWRERLSGELPVLALPADHPRPAELRFAGASHVVRVPEALTARLRELSRARQATLHNTLLAAYAVLLGRYTGQEDLIVGCATAGRPQEFAGVVGYFTNPVPVRIDLSGDPAFLDLIDRVRAVTLEALEHQHLPFPSLVKHLQPDRDPSRSPVFQTDFAMLKPPPAFRHGRGAGLPFEPFPLATEEGQFDLSLHIAEEDSVLVAAFKYNTALFEPATIARLAECFLHGLEKLAENPAQKAGEAPLLAAAERERLIELGRGATVDCEPLPVHRIFERQAELAPEAVAAEEFESGAQWTYADLNCRSNQLARYLRESGVERGARVGVCLPRGLELVAAILGTLKTGAAYVPFDPSSPAARLEFMLRDGGVSVLLTSRAAHLAAPPGVRIVCLEDDWAAIGLQPDENLPDPVQPDDIAYVIYTSGSTGLPKGTLVTHRGLSNYLNWCVEAYRVREGCGAPVSSSIAFDATVTSLFAPLAAGRKVVLLPEDRPLEALADCLRRNRGFSLIKITPAHLEALSHLLAPEECAGRANAFVIGGEALRGDLLAFWRKHAPDTRLINEYGPTETVVGCCIYEARDASAGNVPIGRPIANTRLYVLDSNLQPVPRGVTGELYIGGAGVARGYLNRPDITDARFLADPFHAGGRVFRTGDLARVLPDGNFDFLGRADQQVKIRGYRIELGEIESVLAQHPRVAAALAVLRRERLVAYVVPRGAAPSSEELRSWLAERLPDYMVPAFYQALAEFPVNANGKIDRRALPDPEAAGAGGPFVAPRDALELKIAAIWEEMLGIHPVGVKDNFFDLGGHSLLAVRLMTRLELDLGATVPLSAILRGPTVERLAGLLRAQGADEAAVLVPIHAGGSKPPFYCVPGAGGNVIYLYSLARHLGPDQPFYGLQAAGFEGEAPPHTTVEEMAAHYLASIEAVQPHGPYSLGGHSLGGWVAYEMAQQLLRRGQEVGLIAIVDTAVPWAGNERDTSGWDDALWIAELAGHIRQALAPELEISPATLRALEPEGQIEALKDALRAAGLFPGDAASDHLRSLVRLFRAHYQVRYRLPRNPLPCRVALLRTAVPPGPLPVEGDASWGWAAVAETEVHMIPGEHLTALRAPHVLALADRLAACLDQAQQAAPAGKAATCP